jgi:hypothetical protein
MTENPSQARERERERGENRDKDMYLWLRRFRAGTRAVLEGEKGVQEDVMVEGVSVGTGRLPHMNPTCTVACCAVCTCNLPTHASS